MDKKKEIIRKSLGFKIFNIYQKINFGFLLELIYNIEDIMNWGGDYSFNDKYKQKPDLYFKLFQL
ncbi:MAG: hypothetical protein KGD63_14445 [Candidatus Lokiarchaeota archaeon]|nr:hypothetical protein [Candidatus Lokiarchaeota archaeon]